MQYQARAPAIVPTISHGPMSSIVSEAKPLRRARRLAVQSPAMKPHTTRIPYQVTRRGPNSKAIGCTDPKLRGALENSNRLPVVLPAQAPGPTQNFTLL